MPRKAKTTLVEARSASSVAGGVNIYPDALSTYIDATDVPILQEFCYSQGMSLEIFTDLSRKPGNERLQELLELLETKKRGALERMIYAAQLNATIGANLLKTWREQEDDSSGAEAKISELLSTIKQQAEKEGGSTVF